MSEFIDDLRAVRAAAGEDFQDATVGDKLGFYATGIGLAVHQAGMEAALFAVGTNAYVLGHETVGFAAPLIAAAANGLMSLGVETALTAGTAKGLESFNGATTEISNRFIIADDKAEANMDKLDIKRSKRSVKDKFDTALVAAGVGSAATVLMDYAKHPDAPVEQHRKVGMRTAKALAGLNALLGVTIGGGILVSEEFGTSVVYDSVEYVADSPYTYLAFGALIGIRSIVAAVKHHSKRAAR